MCLLSSVRALLLFLAYSAVLGKAPIFSGKGNRAVTAGSQPPSTWHVRGLFVYVCLTCEQCASYIQTPPPPKKNNSHQMIDSSGIFNHHKQVSVSTESKSGMPLLPSNSTSWRSSISSPGSCPATSSLTPTIYKSWHDTQRWWTSQAQTTICSG